jgi:hypothetical protein
VVVLAGSGARLHEAAEAAGLGDYDLTIHDLRHAAASILIASGLSAVDVADVRGHVIPGSPPDEYDCLIPQLCALLTCGRQREEIEEFLAGELEGHFGIESDTVRERELVRRLVAWAQSRPQLQSDE